MVSHSLSTELLRVSGLADDRYIAPESTNSHRYTISAHSSLKYGTLRLRTNVSTHYCTRDTSHSKHTLQTYGPNKHSERTLALYTQYSTTLHSALDAVFLTDYSHLDRYIQTLPGNKQYAEHDDVLQPPRKQQLVITIIVCVLDYYSINRVS